LTKKNGILKAGAANRTEDAPGFRAWNTDDDQSRGWVEVFGAAEPLEHLDEKHDVFIAAMLRDTEQKWLAAPTGKRSLQRAHGARFDTVVDTARHSLHFDWKVVVEAQKCSFGDAGNGTGRAKALPENQAIEVAFHEAEVRRDLTGIKIVE